MLYIEIESTIEKLRKESAKLSEQIIEYKKQGINIIQSQEQLRGINHEITYLVAVWKGNVDGTSLK